jgi:O-succinylbenzoate synthase
LDEELIGIFSYEERAAVLDEIRPAYVVLKPTLVGGFKSSADWITHCSKHSIGWWLTSALESNVGLNAIAQFVSQYNINMPQGLGTGQLYTNNIAAPLVLSGERLRYDSGKSWDLMPFGR